MPEQALPPVRVMLVDDHRMFAESLSRLLAEEEGIEVLGIATTGAEAVKKAEKLSPNVVLVDYQIPDMDGVAVAAAIKTQAPHTMIVMLTGSADDRVLLAAIEAGCSGFLTKDRAATEVAMAVRTAAAGEALITPALLARLLPKLNRGHTEPGSDLTGREKEILVLLAEGKANKTIANELHLSVNTVRNYVQSSLSKLNAHSKLEAVSAAVRAGIIDYPANS